MMITNRFIISLLSAVLLFTTSAYAEDNGVILVYHHVSTSTPPSTSISPTQFRQHLTFLSKNHNVVSLQEMVNKLKNKQPLPAKSVAITFDDGYRNILDNGHPILKEFGFPYTVFINPSVIGEREDQLNWQQIKSMHQQGVSFANHTQYHNHLLERQENESKQAWMARNVDDLLNAQKDIEAQLDSVPKFVAYPYGEYNESLKIAYQSMGFVGFAQHSGAVSSNSDFGALTRFAAAGVYANLESLKVKLNTLAMPIIKLAIEDPEVTSTERMPVQTIWLETEDLRVGQLNCFLNGQSMAIEKQDNKVILALSEPLAQGRTRINCTTPSKSQSGRYYWYSQPWFVFN